VIQLQSPGNIARGVQRVGRSGHLIDATSKGRIIATHRQDLLESAVIAKSMLDTDIESTQIPRNCLDVLAQQIVACVSVEEWNTDELFALVRQAFPMNRSAKNCICRYSKCSPVGTRRRRCGNFNRAFPGTRSGRRFLRCPAHRGSPFFPAVPFPTADIIPCILRTENKNRRAGRGVYP